MAQIRKPIRLSGHAQQQMIFRGCSLEEIKESIETSQWKQSGSGRLECQKDFIYNKEWNNKLYRMKKVRPVFAESEDEIVVVTVYTYYF